MVGQFKQLQNKQSNCNKVQNEDNERKIQKKVKTINNNYNFISKFHKKQFIASSTGQSLNNLQRKRTGEREND